jgi:hypothetical protein
VISNIPPPLPHVKEKNSLTVLNTCSSETKRQDPLKDCVAKALACGVMSLLVPSVLGVELWPSGPNVFVSSRPCAQNCSVLIPYGVSAMASGGVAAGHKWVPSTLLDALGRSITDIR